MHNCLRAGLLVLLVWLSAAQAVRAESITYRFEGQVDTTTGMVPPSIGDIVSGIVTFEVSGIEAPPGAAAGIFQTRKDIYQLSFAHEPGADPFHSRTLNNQQLTVQVSNNFFGDIGGPFDELDVVLSTLTSPQLGFTIDLIDPTGTVYTNGNLPISPDLEAFSLRHFVGSITEGRAIIGTLGGTITSLTGGPGPSITPEPGSVLLLGPLALSLLGAARMKKSRKTRKTAGVVRWASGPTQPRAPSTSHRQHRGSTRSFSTTTASATIHPSRIRAFTSSRSRNHLRLTGAAT